MKYTAYIVLASLLISANIMATNPPPRWDVLKILVEPDSKPERKNEWRFQIFNIDEKGKKISHDYYGESDSTGLARIGIPIEYFARPLVIYAFSDNFPDDFLNDEDEVEFLESEIFIPANCSPTITWKINQKSSDLWKHFKELIASGSWNPLLSDCGTWYQMVEYLETQPKNITPTN